MNTIFSAFLLLFAIFLQIQTTVARMDRVGYISDPIKLLMQDGYSSFKSRQYGGSEQKRPIIKQIRKRKFSAYPPTFYSSFGFGPMPFSRRQLSLPYTDLLFSGR